MSIRRIRSVSFLLAFASTLLLAQLSQAEPISWGNNLDAAKIEAGRTGKLVLLHFYSESCGPCKKLERDVFSQPQIAVAMERDYIPVKLNADQSPALAHAFQITRVPQEVILNSQGNVLQKLSCPLEPAAYGTQLVNVAQHYRGRSAVTTASAQAPVNSAYAGLNIGKPNSVRTAKAVPAASKAPLTPLVTNNPYINAAPPAAPIAVAQQPRARPTPTIPVKAIPANAMPNSYRNRYAAVPAQAAIAKQPAVTPTSTAQPAAPPAAAAPSNASLAPPARQVAAAAAATLATPKAWPPQLPAGTPSLAFDGCCPVSLQHAQKWVHGNVAFGAIHRGCTYLFAGESQRQKFLANPDAYSPVFSGNDPVKMLDENEQVAGSREFGFAYRGAFYLFSGKETMERFASQPDRYSAGVRQAMNRMDAQTKSMRR